MSAPPSFAEKAERLQADMRARQLERDMGVRRRTPADIVVGSMWLLLTLAVLLLLAALAVGLVWAAATTISTVAAVVLGVVALAVCAVIVRDRVSRRSRAQG